MEDDAIRTKKETREDNMEAQWICRIIGIEDKATSEDSVGRARWQICGTTGMNTATEEMWDGNRRDVGRPRWRNGLEGRQWNGQILTGNNYQPEGVS